MQHPRPQQDAEHDRVNLLPSKISSTEHTPRPYPPIQLRRIHTQSDCRDNTGTGHTDVVGAALTVAKESNRSTAPGANR